MAVDVILGLQWGDEGKGKIVDYLANNYDIVARFQGGPNAGHTLKFDGKKYILHTVPSGIFREHLINVIGNGVVIDPITLKREIEQLDAAGVNYKGRLLVAKKAHLILPSHRMLDAASESAKGKDKIGSTLKGIGPTYMDKTGRNGLRIGDLFEPNFEERYEALKDKHLKLAAIYPEIDFDMAAEEEKWMASLETIKSLEIVEGEWYLNNALKEGKRILAEGAQGSMLDIDYGTYPFVTSSNTITAGVCIGLGLAPQKINEVIGITKAYCTRVGSGPFPTELHDQTGEQLRVEGAEFGSTTGRPRRCGWIDLPQLKYAIMLNGVTQLVITKIDVLNIFDTLKAAVRLNIDGKSTDQWPFDIDRREVVPEYDTMEGWMTSLETMTSFDEMPEQAKAFIHYLEKQLDVPVSMISTGPDRKSLILRDVSAVV
ncbi:MAG: adenylosuccinate synthase [Saprospiraceae bacterium]|nr:adenylosuccinate synthase [Saprospiraceae bacterium]